MAHYGVDLSSNNAHPLNVGSLYAYLFGLGGEQPFAIVKATQGTGYANPEFTADVAALKSVGFAVGGYLMDQGNDGAPGEEAAYKRIASGIPQFDDDELPEGLSVAAYKAHLATLIAQDNVFQYLNQSEVAEGFPGGSGLWLADYNNNPGVSAYPCTIHQYTSSATIPGSVGDFDLNYWMGSEALFATTFSVPTPTPVPPPAPALWARTNFACSVPTGGELTIRNNGTVDTWDGARFYGALAGQHLNAPIVGVASTPTGNGYWLVATDGGVFSFGDALFHGSMGGQKLNAPVVGITPTKSGLGYWLAASDGGIFSFGDAVFYGSEGSTKLGAPIISIMGALDGNGYWLVGSDGGVFSFGSAVFHGGMGGQHLNAPIIAGVRSATGQGYWLLGEDGGVFSFGDAPYMGPITKYLTEWNLGQGHAIPIVGIAQGNSGGVQYTIFGDTGGPTADPYRILSNGSLTS